MYHRFDEAGQGNRVSAKAFERQILKLKQEFNILPLTYIYDCKKNNKKVPDNAIVITIDDGYHDFYTHAYPVLKKHGVPATIYVTSDFIDKKIWLWPDVISYLLDNTKKEILKIKFDGKDMEYKISSRESVHEIWRMLANYCISLTDDKRREFIEYLMREPEVDISREPTDDFCSMSWKELREISDNGVEIGAHTRTHPILSKVAKDRLKDEISGCKRLIEDNINKPVEHFCYPNGQPSDISEDVKNMVKESGYYSAAAAYHDRHGWEDLYEIRRHGVGSGMYHFNKVIYGSEYIGSFIGLT